jgi:hypothetical protein
MKKILTILLGLLFLVASLPGVAIQQLVDPASLTEITNNGDQRSATEEKQEEHFIHYRTRVQATREPVSIRINRQPDGEIAVSIKEQLSLNMLVVPIASLYLQHRSLLI